MLNVIIHFWWTSLTYIVNYVIIKTLFLPGFQGMLAFGKTM